MAKTTHGFPNPKQVEPSRLNYSSWQVLAEINRQRLRDVILRSKPWLRSTGPRMPVTEAQVAINGKRRHIDVISARELQRELAGLDAVIERVAEIRRQLRRDFGTRLQ